MPASNLFRRSTTSSTSSSSLRSPRKLSKRTSTASSLNSDRPISHPSPQRLFCNSLDLPRSEMTLGTKPNPARSPLTGEGEGVGSCWSESDEEESKGEKRRFSVSRIFSGRKMGSPKKPLPFPSTLRSSASSFAHSTLALVSPRTQHEARPNLERAQPFTARSRPASLRTRSSAESLTLDLACFPAPPRHAPALARPALDSSTARNGPWAVRAVWRAESVGTVPNPEFDAFSKLCDALAAALPDSTPDSSAEDQRERESESESELRTPDSSLPTTPESIRHKPRQESNNRSSIFSYYLDVSDKPEEGGLGVRVTIDPAEVKRIRRGAVWFEDEGFMEELGRIRTREEGDSPLLPYLDEEEKSLNL